MAGVFLFFVDLPIKNFFPCQFYDKRLLRKISIYFSLSIFMGSFNLSQAASQIEFPQTIPACPAEFLTDSLLASDGSIWVTSEGKGVFRYFPNKSSKSSEDWMDASYYKGLPDTLNFYALAEDKQGRIWAGTDNKGVAVFNGENWKVYDRENALLGERVFDIAVSPKTGDVAIATSGGVSIYQPGKGDWMSLTRAEGLFEDQVKALSYDLAGDLWLGYACGGVSQLSGKDSYKLVQTVQAKWYWDEKSGARQPLTSTGSGLPSNLCDAILTLRNGSIVVGTTSGIGWLPNRKTNKWKFIRGKEYHEKNMGLMNPPASNIPQAKEEGLLPEDYVTCLAEGNQGIWVGFRDKGAVLLDPVTMRQKAEAKIPKEVKQPWVTSMMVIPNGGVYATTYGFGFVKIEDGDKNRLASVKVADRGESPAHPEIAKILSEEEIAQELAKRDSKFKEEESSIVFWKEDWATQGDWCERYGTHGGVLCATDQPRNDLIGNNIGLNIRGGIGLNKFVTGDLYLQFFQGDIADDPNVLYNPNTGTRVAAQWIDRKEGEYTSYCDGADIWTVVEVPEGQYEIALYFHNYGEREGNRQDAKDYLVEVRWAEAVVPEDASWEDEIKAVMKNPVTVRTRVSNFKGSGVYKSFFANRGGKYFFRVINNYSSATILNAVLVNQLDPEKRIPKSTERFMRVAYGSMPPHPEKVSEQEIASCVDMLKIWRDALMFFPCGKYLSNSRMYQYSLYRTSHRKNAPQSIMLNWRWYLRLWNTVEHRNFESFMLDCWYAKQDNYISTRSEEFFPFSPRVVPFSPKELDVMSYMGIDWKDYLPDAKQKPSINAISLKEKISQLSDSDYKKLQEDFIKKMIENNKST